MPVAPDLCGSALAGRYELHELIGEGAFGCVYRGHDRRLARAVAVKVIKPWWAQDPRWVAAFEREAQLLARVSHPGIVQIYDIGHGPDGLYYVSELVDGESLAARLERGRLAPAEATAVARQLCLALEHACQRGIVHRDVKPANILLAADGAVKLGDFGVARLAGGSSDGATVAGTPRYMAPEQARGRAVSAACDVYSVGVVLYEMLAGVPPFSGGSAVDLALRHLTEPPPPLAGHGVSPQLEGVVMRALAKDPARRFPGAGEMAHALARADSAAQGADTLPLKPTARGRRALEQGAGPVWAITPARGITLKREQAGRQRTARGLVGTALSLIACAGAVAALAGAVLAGTRIAAVPRVVGLGRSAAFARLRDARLRVRLVAVPAAGQIPGDVVAQRPGAGASMPAGSTVVLSVAQAPRWRYLTSLHAGGSGRAPLRILGRRFRLVYSMRYQQSCTFLLFSLCSAPRARVRDLDLGGAPTIASFDLHPGAAVVQTIDAGPGEFELQVSPGGTPADWQITVEDYY